MRSIRVSLLITLILTSLICVYAQRPRSGSDRQAARLKAKEMLVEKLPENVEGVELKEGTVRIRSGYRFVKEGKEVKVMARRAGGRGPGVIKGSWECYCTAGTGGTCEITVTNGILSCSAGSCTSNCNLVVTTQGIRSNILMY